MGYRGAGWLERPSRALKERPQLMVESLGLKPTDTVGDIGAGTGYISFRLSALVSQGKVIAVDAQPEMLNIITARTQELGVTNIETVLGSSQNPNLPPESLDLALLVDAYHEFEYPREMMTGIMQALKPGGRVVLVEYRRENPLIPIKPLHKMTQRQVRKEMQAIGLRWLETQEILPQQHMISFQKPAFQKPAYRNPTSVMNIGPA